MSVSKGANSSVTPSFSSWFATFGQTKSSDQKDAEEAAYEFLSNPLNVVEGVMLFDSTRPKCGIVIFSLQEIKPNKIYYYKHTVKVQRTSGTQVKIGSKVVEISPVNVKLLNEDEGPNSKIHRTTSASKFETKSSSWGARGMIVQSLISD
jgi:hypothetical protein